MRQNYLSKWNEEQEKMVNVKKRGKSNKPESLHKYQIDYKMIANWFNYKSAKTFNSSSNKEEMLDAIDSIIRYVEEFNK
jgi:hypothetical protein